MLTDRQNFSAVSLSRLAMVAMLVGFASACQPSDDLAEPEPEAVWPNLACDPLVPSYCGMPFPSNVYTTADPSTPTGRRIAFLPETMPVNYYEVATVPDSWNRNDGFSPGLGLLADFPGATVEGLADPLTIERSLEPDSPTVVIDSETGEWIPHFAEIDRSNAGDSSPSFMIRPVVRLADATRYIVAIRNVQGEDGRALEPTLAFAALRDRRELLEEESIGERRGLYADIFHRLGEAGVERSDLQLAWDFTTASRENNTDWMVHMRDEALAMVGPAGPSYEITSVDEDWETEHIAYRIFGNMTVPLYLDQTAPGAQLQFGADGLPEAPTMAEFEFEVLIPHSATESPAALLQYGHGLLGEKEQIQSSHFLDFIDEYNYVLFAVDWIGLAADDETYIGAVLESGRFDRFQYVIDRQMQGMLNALLAMRMMVGGFANDPTYGSMVGDEHYYHGISQGGIFGATYMALSTDVTRGVLGVMGQPYHLLLNRSVDFDIFFDIVKANYADSRDQQVLLGLAQMAWDRTEPNGYTPYLRENMLPETPSHEVLMRAALGDHQVTTLGAHIMARSLKAKHLDSGLRDIYGLEKVAGPYDGTVYVEYDFGLPPDPIENVPQEECEDPHGKVRKLEEARQQLDLFLRTGTAQSFCNGPCSFPDMSGC